MARAENVLTFPRSSSLTRNFEELPLYSEKTANGDVFYAGLVDGTVEISYSGPSDWWISDIHIKVDNGRMGRQGVAKLVNVNADENPSLYWLLLDILTDKYGETITEWVYLELQEEAA
jgi:hypothetical protein